MADRRLPVVGRADPLERLLAGDSGGVIADLRERVEAAPDDEVAWLQLGAAYVHIEHWPQAAEALARAVELDGDLQARRLYARVLRRLRRFDEAAFQLVQAKRLAPDDAVVARELGAAFYDKRLYPKALRELERSRDLDGDSAATHFAIGLAHEGLGDVAAAIAAYREAIARDAGFVDARRTLADALASMGEMAEAVAQLTEAQRHDRTNTQIAANLEVLAKALRELEAARLLGKTEAEVERSALIQEGQLKRHGFLRNAGEADTALYRGDMAELQVQPCGDTPIEQLTLVLSDPERAALAPGDPFEVTVVSADGRRSPANYATAITVTFLREALGCPLTRASALYAELLRAPEDVVRWGGATLRFAATSLQGEPAHGIRVELESQTSQNS